MGGRSICPRGSKVVPYNTEGRFQLDKPAPETKRRPRVLGWGTARKAGATGEPGTAGEGPRGSPSPRLSWLGPWWAGVVGERAPPPRLARLLGLGRLLVGVCWCPYCVRLCMTCSSVTLAPPNYPPTAYLYRGAGCLVLCAMARAKTFRVRTLGRHLGAGALQRAAQKPRSHSGGTSWVICRVPGWRERGPPPAGPHNLFFLCVFLSFFPLR